MQSDSRQNLSRYLTTRGVDLEKNFNLLVYCEQPSHLQNVALPLIRLSSFNDTSVLLVTKYTFNDYPLTDQLKRLRAVDGIPPSYLQFFKADLLYTPMVGLRIDFVPENCKVIHSLVSLVSLDGVYDESMFDAYDYILCAGAHQIQDFIRWANLYDSIRGTILIPAGYPKLELARSWSTTSALPSDLTRGAVVYAPTHVYDVNEKYCSLRTHGQEIINVLIQEGLRVIFRPHPVSLNMPDQTYVNDIIKRFKKNDGFFLDIEKEYRYAFEMADFLVTDVSGVGFTFSFSTGKPTVFYDPSRTVSKLKGIQYHCRADIGLVVSDSEELRIAAQRVLTEDYSSRIESFKESLIFNIGKSSDYVAWAIRKILSKQPMPDAWVEV